MEHSMTGDLVKPRTFLSINEERIAVTIPHMIDQKPSVANSSVISRQLEPVNLSFLRLYVTTVLNKMIDTASFVMPSPKTSEKSFGCFSGLISDTAAITSVEQSRLHMRITSNVVRSSGVTSPVEPLVWVS